MNYRLVSASEGTLIRRDRQSWLIWKSKAIIIGYVSAAKYPDYLV